MDCFTSITQKTLEDIIPYVNNYYQTISYFGVDKHFISNMVTQKQLSGIDNIVPVGKQTLDISLTWDGYKLSDYLTRSINII